jgi:ubiquinone/menaquinone biosynthesis C-methylase UbiE
MQEFLFQKFDLNDPNLVSIIDELPLWSAPFGLKLLDTINLRPNINILDIGFGTGFPLIELSQRFGKSCRIYGIDPWEKAIERVKFKIEVMNIENVVLYCGVAEDLPFNNNFFDLIVSNNGMNNVNDEEKSLSECSRVSRPGAQFVMTYNLPDTMNEFYEVYKKILRELDKKREIDKLNKHIFHKRKPLKFFEELLVKYRFKVIKVQNDSFKMRYLDGSTMFNHYFIKLAFLESWKNILSTNDFEQVFSLLEDRLNRLAGERGEISLTIPFVCLDCQKQ